MKALPAQEAASSTFFGWQVEGGKLMAGTRTCREVADDIGTPLYLYSEPRILERAQLLKRAFGDFTVLYAIKSNPQPRICELLAAADFQAEVSSLREFELALSAGYAPEDIGYVGPGKRLGDLHEAARRGCGVFYAESKTELAHLETVSKELGRQLRVALRINTQHRPTAAGEFMAGGPSEFGIDEEELDRVISDIDRDLIELVGFHTFVASQVVEMRALERHFERVASISCALAEKHDVNLDIVNFGGGFGIPYAPYERALDLSLLGERVAANRAIEELRRRWPEAQLCLDVGRFLVGDAGVFMAGIVDVKKSRGSTFVILDSGITAFARPALPWAQQHPSCIVDRVTGEDLATVSCTVVGPSCMPGDLLASSVDLSCPAPGDVLCFMNAGAYGRTMSLPLWGGFAEPVEANFDGVAVTSGPRGDG